MELSLKLYGWKCVLGAEVAYVLCLLGGFLPFRSRRPMRQAYLVVGVTSLWTMVPSLCELTASACTSLRDFVDLNAMDLGAASPCIIVPSLCELIASDRTSSRVLVDLNAGAFGPASLCAR